MNTFIANIQHMPFVTHALAALGTVLLAGLAFWFFITLTDGD